MDSKPKVFQYFWDIIKIYGAGKNINAKKLLIAVTLFSVYMFIQATAACIMNWSDPKRRFKAIEDLDLLLYSITFFFEFLFYSKNPLTLLNVIESDFYDYKGRDTAERKTLIRNRISELTLQLSTFVKILLVYTLNIYIAQLVLACYRLMTRKPGEEIMYNHFFPAECYFPFKIDSFFLYISIYACYLLYCFRMFHICAVFIGAPVGAQHKLATDIMLLSQSFKDIDKIDYIYGRKHGKDPFKGGTNKLEKISDDNYWTAKEDKEEELLRLYTKNLIESYNILLWRVKETNKAVCISALGANQGGIVLGCLNLYCFMEMVGTFYKLKYGLAVVNLGFIIIFYSYNGERIVNEAEGLRFAMYDCSWLDKPQWFKKSLILTMTRANRIIEIKPLGLYVLNFRNVTNVLNAAYVYCNFLRTIRRK